MFRNFLLSTLLSLTLIMPCLALSNAGQLEREHLTDLFESALERSPELSSTAKRLGLPNSKVVPLLLARPQTKLGSDHLRDGLYMVHYSDNVHKASTWSLPPSPAVLSEAERLTLFNSLQALAKNLLATFREYLAQAIASSDSTTLAKDSNEKSSVTAKTTKDSPENKLNSARKKLVELAGEDAVAKLDRELFAAEKSANLE